MYIAVPKENSKWGYPPSEELLRRIEKIMKAERISDRLKYEELII